MAGVDVHTIRTFYRGAREPYSDTLLRVAVVVRAVEDHGGNVSHAAEALRSAREKRADEAARIEREAVYLAESLGGACA